MVDLEEIKKEYESILQKLSNPELILNWKDFEDFTKRKNLLEKIIEKNEEIKNLRNQIEEDKGILKAKEDPQLLSLAEEEINRFKEREKFLERELENLIKSRTVGIVEDAALPSQKAKEAAAAAIVEIRAGTGGEEAALFAKDLFKMYSKYAQSQGWRQKILDSRETDQAGFKMVTFELSNSDVFSKMKYEGGVHRVQRIPLTEKAGRVHTSTATIAVLPKPKKTRIKINPQDIRIDLYRASGPGGQYVNRRETAVRITHLSSGIMVTSQTERNQLQNKENAISILEARLLEQKKRESEEKLRGSRKAQIGWAKRSEKIRTYNIPQNRLTDHRIKKSWKNLNKILAGNLDPIIKTLDQRQEDDQ